MSKTSLQYQVLAQGGPVTEVSVPYPTPGPTELCIRPKAVAINGLDWKRRLYGVMVDSWPIVMGIDAAGIVDSVGTAVKDFKAGDEVFFVCGTASREAGFQEVITVSLLAVAKKPSSLTFEEAASLPQETASFSNYCYTYLLIDLRICYITAASAISHGLHVPLPYLDPTGTSPLKTILVLGGSSNIGAGAIQLLRLALPDATILTTSSSQHHAHLISLGATKCFERSVQSEPSSIKAATPGGVGVDAILDTVQAAVGQPQIFGALNPTGPNLYSYVMTGQNIVAPERVKSTMIFARQIFDTKGGINAIPALADLIKKGEFKLPSKVKIVAKGFHEIEQGLDANMRGVSGVKCVLSL